MWGEKDMYKINAKKISMLLIAFIILFVMLIVNGCNNMTGKSVSGNMPKVVKKADWTEVGDDIFVFTSDFYMANMIMVISGNEAIMVDTGMDKKDRQRIQGFLDERKLILKNIIITHMHDDHAANLKAIKTEEMAPITPENAKNNKIIKLGNKTFSLIFTEGHYKPKQHISVEVNDNLLIAGDVICNNVLPPIAAGGDLEDLKKKNYSLIIPGHGEIVDTNLIFKRQFEYLNNAKEKVEKIISSGGKMSDLNNIKLGDCIKDPSYLYNERLDYWHRMSLQTIYLQLKQKKSNNQ